MEKIVWLDSSWKVFFAVALIALVGLVLRSNYLVDRSLIFDEAFFFRMSRLPFREMVDRAAHDNHPPLYFIVLKLWTGLFGQSVLAIRSLSAVLGALAVIGMYLFASEAFRREESETTSTPVSRGRRAGLLVASLVAVSVFQIYYAEEVRMYVLGAALLPLSSWALFRALRPSARPYRRWLLYGFLTLLFAYTHYYALFSIAAQGIFLVFFLLVRSEWSFWKALRSPFCWQAASGLAIVALGWLPWVPVFLARRAAVQADFWTEQITSWDIPRALYQMFNPVQSFPSQQFQLLTTDLCAVVLLALTRKARAAEWYILSAAVIPFVLSVIISQHDTKVFCLRYFLFAHLFLLAALAILIDRIPFALERTVVAALMVLLAFGVDLAFWQNADIASKPGSRGASEFIKSHRGPGEPVVVCSPLFYFPISYYLRNDGDCYSYDYGTKLPQYLGTTLLSAQDFMDNSQLASIGSRRIWVVDMEGGFWGKHSVPVPGDWASKTRKQFLERDGLGYVVVIEYETTVKENTHGN